MDNDILTAAFAREFLEMAVTAIDRSYTDRYLPPDARRVEVAHEVELDETHELPAVQS